MQTEGDAAIFQQQLITAAARINRRFAVMQQDKTRRLLRGLNPDAQAERIDTRKMPEPGKREAILTAQFGGAAQTCRQQIWIFVNVGPFVGRGQIGDLVRNDLVESEVTGQSWICNSLVYGPANRRSPCGLLRGLNQISFPAPRSASATTRAAHRWHRRRAMRWAPASNR